MIELIGRLLEMLHLRRKLRTIYYVDGANGLDANSGLTAEDPFLTITQAITAAVDGDGIVIAEGTYDENGLDFGSAGSIDGLEIWFEPGVIINNSDPDTCLTVSGVGIRIHGNNVHLEEGGEVGMNVAATGINCLVEDVLAVSCATGFDIDGHSNTFRRCRSVNHATFGWDIVDDTNFFDHCVALGDGGATGFNLPHANADNNIFDDCIAMNNGVPVSTVAGADGNVFNRLCIGAGEVIADAGANNVFPNLSEGSQIVAGQSRDQDIADIFDRQDAMIFSKDFWSLPQEEVYLTGAAGDKALPDVTVAGIPAGATITGAYVMYKFRMIQNINAAANKLDGAQEIQIRDDSPSAWIDAINFVDDQYTLGASTREGGDVAIGLIDVSATVDGNDTYNFQWDEGVADLDGIKFNDIQIGLRVEWSI